MVLLSSRTEGMPVALIEAGAASLPVISTPVGGVPELVLDGETGRLADGVEGLARALCELASDDELRLRMGQAARARVRERHSAAALAESLERVYAEVAGEVACAS
jgi:glycosyltransferase involved in cell wall biosynthesis